VATAERANSVVERVLSYDLDEIVEHYADSYGLPLDVARTHERELKRYLALRALDPDGVYGMAGVVDKLWHAFILFTKDYERFCNEAVGFFVHHVPRTKSQGLEGSPYEDYARTLAAYERVFGEPAPRETWPRYPDKGVN
jgi:hypothetical protein